MKRCWFLVNYNKLVYYSAQAIFFRKSIGENVMLILTRRVGESIIIGDDITLTVLGVKGNQVRIGINAPKDVSVHREEIYQRIQSEKTDGSEQESLTIQVNESSSDDTRGNE